MSQSNGKHAVDVPAVQTKALVEVLTSWVKKRLETVESELKEAVAQKPGTVNLYTGNSPLIENRQDMEPVAKEVGRMREVYEADLTERVKDRATMRDLIDTVNGLPVPMVGATSVVNKVLPTPVTFDLTYLEAVLASLTDSIHELVDSNKAIQKVMTYMVKVLESIEETNQSLTKAVSRDRPKRELEITTPDGVITGRIK